MQAQVSLAKLAAGSTLPVLIQGETGVGKEVVAQALHAWSPRRDRPFVQLNCSAIPENLLESELFGHVKGSFSGAVKDRPGRFLAADGGTLLLDEIGDMPLSAQTRLLRVLQEGRFEAVGSDRTLGVDVRVIAATHVDLPAAVRAGRFREDLYYRLAVFPLQIPPLRERPEDLLPLARGFLEGPARRGGRGPWILSPEAQVALRAAPWPGNIRQLLNSLERATLLLPQGRLEVRHLGLAPAPPARSAPPRSELQPLPTLVENERQYLEEALRRCEGRIYGPEGAAALVGLKPTTLQSRLLKLGIRRRGQGDSAG